MGEAKRRGTREERVQKSIEQFNKEIFPNCFCGYSRKRRPDELPFDLGADGLVCTLVRITEKSINEAQADFKEKKIELYDWFVSPIVDSAEDLFGPFKKVNDAFQFARLNFGAIQFGSPPYTSNSTFSKSLLIESPDAS